MATREITSILSRDDKRGIKKQFTFSGVEAQERVDDYMTEIGLTKDVMEAAQTEVKAAVETTDTNASAAKQYASDASASATAAAKSAAKAESSANNVGDAVTAAAESASKAAASETAAKESETSAANSAETASAYANSNYAIEAKSYAVGGTGTRDGEDTDNAAYYYSKIKDTDVRDLAELEKLMEKNLNSINHDQSTYPAFVADRLSNVTNLNDCITNGIYQFTATASNNPVNAIGMVLVLNSTGSGEKGYIAQYAWAGSDAHTVYARDDHNGTWGAWEQVGADGSSLTDLITRMTTAETNISTNSKNIETIQGDLTTLIGSNSGKSAYEIALLALTTALVPEGAKESLDTLEEIAAWIQSHPDDASKMSEQISSLSKNVSTLATAVASKADKATTLAGYGIEDGATASALSDLSDMVDTKADSTEVSHIDDRVSGIVNDVTTLQTEVNARPSTRKLSTQTLTASGGTLTWTDSCIGSNSLIDVYASIPNIAPSAITQSGTTVTVTFDAQSEAFSVAIVIMN